MSTPARIDAILFDMGGTLRTTTRHTDVQRRTALSALNARLGTRLTPEEWDERLVPRARDYKRWSEETWNELTEEEIWTRWMLPELPEDEVRPRAVELHRFWRHALGTSEMRPEAQPLVRELFRRGYRLGIISNTSSRVDAPEALAALGILASFETVVLSSAHGRRKPDPLLFELATGAMEVDPARCAFVGNRPDVDVPGARQAGFAMVILLRQPERAGMVLEEGSLAPDRWIENLDELLTIFPPRYTAKRTRSVQAASAGRARWRASLSTMWGSQFARLDEFFQAAARLGFHAVELNHEVDSSMLAASDLGVHRFSSVHEPCPTDVPTGRMAALDWQISSEDETNRRQAVRLVKRSIHLARDLGAGLVVVHPGNAGGNGQLEKDLRALFNAGQVETAPYLSLMDQLLEHRRQIVGLRMEATLRSLAELLACAREEGIVLGLENRYHYLDIPTPDEMAQLLATGGPNELGLVYDVGHAQTMQHLGFFRHLDWLDRFADRIVEVHLHDVRGVDDHLAPGLGQVDFNRIAPYLPASALRTCELRPQNTGDQVLEGMEVLVRCGCVEAA